MTESKQTGRGMGSEAARLALGSILNAKLAHPRRAFGHGGDGDRFRFWSGIGLLREL